jgi:hypothetical protein
LLIIRNAIKAAKNDSFGEFLGKNIKLIKKNHQMLLKIYSFLFPIHQGKHLEKFREEIEYLLASLHKPMTPRLMGPASIEDSIHIIHQVLSSIYLALVHPETKTLRKLRYSTKTAYHLDRISHGFFQYFMHLACINDVHKNLHEFQRDEMGFSQFADLTQRNERGGKFSSSDENLLQFTDSRIDKSSSSAEFNQNFNQEFYKNVDPDTINVASGKQKNYNQAKAEKNKDPFEKIKELEDELLERGIDAKEEGIRFEYPKWRLRKLLLNTLTNSQKRKNDERR